MTKVKDGQHFKMQGMLALSPTPQASSLDLVLLHGANGCQSELLPWARALTDAGFVVHSFNLAGHGGRPIPAYLSMEVFAKDLLAQMDAAGLRAPLVMGYSFGGLLALYLASHHPDRVRAVIGIAAKFIFDAATVQHFTHLLQVTRLMRLPHRRDHLAQVHQPNDWRHLVEALHDCFASLAVQTPLTVDDLKAIACPVLAISGTQDPLVKAEEMQSLCRSLARADLGMFEGSAHPAQAVPTDRLVKTVRRWVDNIA